MVFVPRASTCASKMREGMVRERESDEAQTEWVAVKRTFFFGGRFLYCFLYTKKNECIML